MNPLPGDSSLPIRSASSNGSSKPKESMVPDQNVTVVSAAQPIPAAQAVDTPEAERPGLARQIGLFDSTMLVMGGIVGAGIFMNPAIVARQLHSTLLIVAVWILAGGIALLGAFIYAELAGRMPSVGGQYAYLRDAYHPAVGFLYGWVLLWVIQTGGMAAVTVTFSRYFLELTEWHLSERVVSVATLAILTFINCLAVKLGSRVQSVLMVLKIGVIAVLMAVGFLLIRNPHPIVEGKTTTEPFSFGLLTAFGAAMLPALFSYGGWQTSNFVAGEITKPRVNLPRALVAGVAGVIALYIGVTWISIRTLGRDGLANTDVPASAVMRTALGDRGATFIAFGIALSALGFLSQSILTGPRVYFAMAEDRLFPSTLARVSRTTRVPIAAILLQSAWTALIAVVGGYEQILSFDTVMDFFFVGLTATCLFILRANRKQSSEGEGEGEGFRVPGHPWTTIVFIGTCWLVVANGFYKYPASSAAGLAILFAGVPAYLFWQAKQEREVVR